MSLIRPFAGLRPQNTYTEGVIAPPYDVLNTQEALARSEGKPWSFLHISRPEIDLPPDTDPYAPQVYAKGVENLQKMLDAGILCQDFTENYYLYQLIMGNHTQTGLVAAASVEAYDNGHIRRHELTRPDKEDDRVRQIDALNAQTGPVLLAYKQTTDLQELIDIITQTQPQADVIADDQIRHRLWVVSDNNEIQKISNIINKIKKLYIADGHHRSAAASRVAKQRREQNPQHSGEESYNYFLTVMFPDVQMKILPYNRIVKDLNHLSEETFLEKIGTTFKLRPLETAFQPTHRGEIGMFCKGKWYQLEIPVHLIPNDPVQALDVSILSDQLLAPILGITDLRRDKRIDFIGGIRGLNELEKRVNSGEMAVAFAMFPTSLGELMNVADANQIMPPKSTWFEPKLADGLVSHVLGNLK
jgi:uncharacterized protein (DUF1015 family)